MTTSLRLWCTGLLILAGSARAAAQCTPNPNNTALITPDTITNFVSGTVGQPYMEIAYVHPPADTMANVPPFGNLTVNITDITMDNLIGLPPGLNFNCNPGTCIFPGGTSNCILISGTPTTPGTYNLQVPITINGTVVIIGQTIPVSEQDTITQYRIIIAPASSGIGELAGGTFGIDAVAAGAAGMVSATLVSAKPQQADIGIYDLLGSRLAGGTYLLAPGTHRVDLETGPLRAGFYFMSVKAGNGVLTRRFVVLDNR